MNGYIVNRLDATGLDTIIDNIRTKYRFLTDDQAEQDFILQVRHSRDFDWFVVEREKALKSYYELHRRIEEKLAQMEAEPDPLNRLKEYYPLLEEALYKDGYLRAFNTNYQPEGSMLHAFIDKMQILLRKVAEKAGLDENLDNTVKRLNLAVLSMYPKETYPLQVFRDMLLLVEMLREDKVITQTDPPDVVITNLKELLNLRKENNTELKSHLARCMQRYARNSVPTLVSKLFMYTSFWGLEKSTLQDVTRRKEEEGARKAGALSLIYSILDDDDRAEFDRLLFMIDTLLTYEHIEDPARGAVLDGLEDYFLREDVAKALNELGKISTSDPMDYPQHYLLRCAFDAISNS